MWSTYTDDAVSKTMANIERFAEAFPHVSSEGQYQLNDNTEWTSGFWPGMLWLCYEYSGDGTFREAAEKTIVSFEERLRLFKSLDHHDIGFLYILTSKAHWLLTGNEASKDLSIQAAELLSKRWRAAGGYLQAWGPEGDEQNGGRIIIDCLMNLPLLFWATEQTGEEKYKALAIAQADLSRKFLVRGDDSSYHTFTFSQESGMPIGGTTHQGWNNGSTWSRGQAWGIYGFGLAYRYTGNPSYLDTAKRLGRYFVGQLPEDHVAPWDFDVPFLSGTPRDSSASAIAACGLLELLAHMPEEDADYTGFSASVQQTMASLAQHYSTFGQADAQGLLEHGSYHVRGGLSPDDYMVWGDYFYLEALLRLQGISRGYW